MNGVLGDSATESLKASNKEHVHGLNVYHVLIHVLVSLTFFTLWLDLV